jgi:hypothetical protein
MSSSFSLSPVDDGDDAADATSGGCGPAGSALSGDGDDCGDRTAWLVGCMGSPAAGCRSADSVRRRGVPASEAAAASAAGGGCVAVRLSGEVNSACAAAMAGDTGDAGRCPARPEPDGVPFGAWSAAAHAVLTAAGVERTLVAAAFGEAAPPGAAAASPVSRRQRLGDAPGDLGELTAALADAVLGEAVRRSAATAPAGEPAAGGPFSPS